MKCSKGCGEVFKNKQGVQKDAMKCSKGRDEVFKRMR